MKTVNTGFGRTTAALLFGVLCVAPLHAQEGWSFGDRSLGMDRAPRLFLADTGRVVMGATAADPTGDTFGSSGVSIDITQLSAEVQSGSLVVELSFAGNVAPPDSFLDNSVSGFIDLDTDQNGMTGDIPWADNLSGSDDSGMGNEFYVDLFSFDSTTGFADVVDDATEAKVGDAAVSFGASSLTVSVPLTTIGNDDGFINVAAVVGNLDTATDKAPNAGAVASAGDSGPEPPDPNGCSTTTTENLSACTPSQTTACLNDSQFEVTAQWEAASTSGGLAQIHEATSDTAIFYFQNEANLELMLKVLNGCTINDSYWVFAGGLTDLGVTIEIRDTLSGEVMTCKNEEGTEFTPIRLTDAFDSCL